MSALSALTGNTTTGKYQPFQSIDASSGRSSGVDFAKMLTEATAPSSAPSGVAANPALSMAKPVEKDKLKETFNEFVGNVVFGQMLSSMRKTVGKTPYFHGGRGEEVFQNQLDQELTKHLSEASADQFANPMFELFQLQRNG
jgi:peptidoglycan hydrolase FlgJ